MIQKFESVNDTLSFIHAKLKGYRLKDKDAHKATLMAEESLTRLTEHADFSGGCAIYAGVSKLFGNVRIILKVPGAEFDFAGTLNPDMPFADEGMPEAQEAIQNILLRSFEDRLKYSHRKGFNTIRINAVTSSRASFSAQS